MADRLPLLFSSWLYATISLSALCCCDQVDGDAGVFSTEKRWGTFAGSLGTAACTTRPEPPRSMPPRKGDLARRQLFVGYNSWAAVRNQANWPGIHGIGTRVGTLSAGYRARGLGVGGTSSRASSKENPSRLSSVEKTQGGCHAIHSQEAFSAGPWHRCAKMIFTTNAYDTSSQPIRRKY